MKKFRLEEWAAIGQIVGGLAIVVTLVMLVLETRANTNAIQAQTYQALSAELNATRRSRGQSDMAAITLRARESGVQVLAPEERFRLLMDTEAMWAVYESAFYAHQRGVLGTDEWARFHSAICRNQRLDRELWDPSGTSSEGLMTVAGSTLATNVTPRFREYVERACKA